MKRMTEEERLLAISSRYHSEDEEYFEAGEDVGYLLQVLQKRDNRIDALEKVVELAREMSQLPPEHASGFGLYPSWSFSFRHMLILKEALAELEALDNA